jgi:hypothetical protein
MRGLYQVSMSPLIGTCKRDCAPELMRGKPAWRLNAPVLIYENRVSNHYFPHMMSISFSAAGPPMIRKMVGMMNSMTGMVISAGRRFAFSSILVS